MRTTLLFICIIWMQSSFAQYSPEDYKSYPDSVKQLFFKDEFTNPADSNWLDKFNNEKKAVGVIDGGKLRLKQKMFRFWAGADTIVAIDQSANFEIEFSAKISNALKQGGYFFWGRNECRSTYDFIFNHGYIEIGYCPDNDIKHYKIIQSARFYNPNPEKEFHTYTIRKVDKHYYFFLDGNFIRKIDFMPFYGNRIGLGSGRNQEAYYDYLKIQYLPATQPGAEVP